MITVYGLKNCDTCKKARLWLDQHGIAHRFHDFRIDGLDEKLLDLFFRDCSWENLLNRRGTTWRSLTEEERCDVDNHRAKLLCLQYPALLKRPILDTEAKLVIGFDEKECSSIKQNLS